MMVENEIETEEDDQPVLLVAIRGLTRDTTTLHRLISRCAPTGTSSRRAEDDA